MTLGGWDIFFGIQVSKDKCGILIYEQKYSKKKAIVTFSTIKYEFVEITFM